MKIRQLQLKNIGVFDDETIEFKDCEFNKGKDIKDRIAEIHIFTGQNGSGKTTILQALICKFEFFAKSPSTIFTNSHPLPNNFHKRFRENSSILIISDYLSDGRFLFKTKVEKDSRYDFPVGWQEEESPNDYWASSISKGQKYDGMSFRFAAFALSGYRYVETEQVQANFLPKNFNPLSQSLEFVKNYRQENEISINQLVANNISNRALSKEDGSLEEAQRYETVITAIETFIKDVTDYEVKFVLKRSPNELKLKMHGEELDFDVLPDGLRSLISWIADLLGRVDMLNWQDDLPINEKNLILLLDEIEVHLHPEWQRKVLPVIQKLFKNSQIFVSTHSPFVVNSVDDAWVYKLELENGKSHVASVEKSEDARSYRYVLRNTFDIEDEFGIEIEKRLKDFYRERDAFLSGNGNSKKAKSELKKIAKELSVQSKELKTKMDFELFQLSEITGEDF